MTSDSAALSDTIYQYQGRDQAGRHFVVIPGLSALSAFRQEKFRTVGMTSITAHYLHFAVLDAPLSGQEQQILRALLTYGEENLNSGAKSPKPENLTTALVVPRSGSISPWSSKATEIAHRCGLQSIYRLERGIQYHIGQTVSRTEWQRLRPMLHDRMTQQLLENSSESGYEKLSSLFHQAAAKPLISIPVLEQGEAALAEANQQMGLALSQEEQCYLLDYFQSVGRDPTDVELMMFAQANSEHCRHKIFNALWLIDGLPQENSLFDMIRNSERCSPQGTILAYRDNAAIMAGGEGERFYPAPDSKVYRYQTDLIHTVMKVETHNHPTAISPYPGAATGSGGEIRDEGATGQGSKPKAGLTGFSVSNLRFPDAMQPWESNHGKPERIVSALEIMLEGPLGAAAFNNEFGRPNLAGYFRTFEEQVTGEIRGYHKPIMIAGGVGTIIGQYTEKLPLPVGALLVQLGGPAMLIGLGGGAASSQSSGSSHAELDFKSVQRENAEMQRRCQEVISCCCQLGENNPILSIHDVGAGGLSNAIPELIHGGGVGGQIELGMIPNADPSMSPMEIWCNEAQERYVLAITAQDQQRFTAMCTREQCPVAFLGTTTQELRLVLSHHASAQRELGSPQPIDMSLETLLGNPPQMQRQVSRHPRSLPPLSKEGIELVEAAHRVLSLPTVADKGFLITIGDRSVTGLVCRDQMVGPWQVPVADVAVTSRDYAGNQGEAMAMGERTPVALIHGPASARLAIAEAVTNIAAASITQLSNLKLSANWMAATGHPGEDLVLFDTVQAVGMELCPQLGIGIPVGKDSLSMKTIWADESGKKEVVAPVSLIISAFAPVTDVRRTMTPQLRSDQLSSNSGETVLIGIDLSQKKNRLGGSVLAQVYKQVGNEPADLDQPALLVAFFAAIQRLNRAGKILAYHDRSDGGLFVTLCEMAFAGHVGLAVDLAGLGEDPLAVLFAEEPGAVIQVAKAEVAELLQVLQGVGHVQTIGTLSDDDHITFSWEGKPLLRQSRIHWQRLWAETSYKIRQLRDNPQTAQQEYDALLDGSDPGLNVHLGFDLATTKIRVPLINTGVRPEVAILREQGSNGQVEMAAAFHRAGFNPVDLPMSDLLAGRRQLTQFKGMAVCGGFSYGDVLGAGEGWAKSILFNKALRRDFKQFFQRKDTFTLGVCNGCQMLSALRSLIPGTEFWPRFVNNTSTRFEARFSLVEIPENHSVLMAAMAGSQMPVASAHGEGRAQFAETKVIDDLTCHKQVVLRFVNNHGAVTESYPANPNGSPQGITGVTSTDGRVTIMMPHPERVFRTVQNSWHPDHWQEDGPWLQLFHNARAWLG